MSAAAPPPGIDEPRFLAGLDMLRRTGAVDVQLRYQDDQEPTVWMALAGFNPDGDMAWKVGASFSPPRALFALLESVIDGARCTHCSKPCGIVDDHEEMPFEGLCCWYQYDPELKTYRRGCE